MASADLVDYSPQDPSPRPPLANATNLILIDNYDSFTWNVYQYLILEGAAVTVFRNDKITLPELVALKPTQLVISPGPGHPSTDSGISNEAIKHFAGKIPILGVCMGQQCMITAFGGEVSFAGEILHGKTSPLKHDAGGLYLGLAQDIPVTRYHSLAGTHISLPDCFKISSWCTMGQSPDSSVIMGVRHKEHIIEGVQFHPESILTAEGRVMMRNFLGMHGGTWEQNQKFQKEQGSRANGLQTATAEDQEVGKSNILDNIYRHRRQLIAEQKLIPSQRLEDLKMQHDMDLSPPSISFVDRLRQSPFPLSLMAEIKRASPSKGDIALSANAPYLARAYANAGASVISVLTEPKWFKGSLDDLKAARHSVGHMRNRPAILRKEFIFDEYQILEARLAGADSVLLIVKMLEPGLLSRLYTYSVSLGMEPLVEVNNDAELKVALNLKAKVIGVNNRNLTNFEVDLDTTSRLMDTIPKDTIVCALSGVSGPADIAAYKQNGVGAVLVGEALMKAQNLNGFVERLFTVPEDGSTPTIRRPKLVKICGVRTLEAAKVAVAAGADLIGLILVDGRKRKIPLDEASKISEFVHSTQKPAKAEVPSTSLKALALDYFSNSASRFESRSNVQLVGVFQNQPLDVILSLQESLKLDIVQLHGSEPLEWTRLIPVPVIKAFKPGDQGLGARGYHALPLLDSARGGTGQVLDLEAVKGTLTADPGLRIILAGGLNEQNVQSVLQELSELSENIVGVDVSSGVESDGVQSLDLIKAFIGSVKGVANGQIK